MTPAQRAARERREQERERRDQALLQRERAEAQAREEAQGNLPALLRVELTQFRPWRTFLAEDGCTSTAQLGGDELAEEILKLPSVQQLLRDAGYA